ncbi:MAG: alpha/beta hydrolase, partial [Spirochaetales bacterium]|nr:alpha/beta hydrolase [Spirochaetales bacterium]
GLNSEEIELLKQAMVTGNDSGEGFFYDVEHRAKDIDTIRCPTLITHSRKDGSVPFSHAEHAHSRIQNSELFEAPTASHFMYFGPGSKEVLERRLAFLTRGESRV